MPPAGASPPSDGMRQLGPYRLLSQLAVGGMAEIYVARTNGVGGFEKLVALKVIHPNYSEDPDFVQMLVDEAKLAVQLTHGNIVQTFDLGRVDQQYYIAMELIDGVDLYKLLRTASEKEIDFPFEVAAFIAAETSSGLDYAHRKRDSRGRPLEIVHRDISPQNILVSNEGEVKIVDFGIAKAALRTRQTAAGVIKGKYYYMSPEQAWGDPIDARTDVFSTGILLYEMLIGQMLYLEEDLEQLLAKVRKAEIPLPSTKRAGVPPELEQIVMTALKKRLADRYQSAQELQIALQAWLRKAAPDFTRARLAAFVREVLGPDENTTANRLGDKRATTAHTREMLARDENSLLFKLSELKPPTPAPVPSAPVKPRSRDQATAPVSLPEVRSALKAVDFEENDQTVVDGASATLLASADLEPTRAASAEALRNDDEDEDTLFGESGDDEATLAGDPTPDAASRAALQRIRELPTAKEMGLVDEERPLPGVRSSREARREPTPSREARREPTPSRPVARAPLERPPSPPRSANVPHPIGEDDEATAQHKKPRPRAPVESHSTEVTIERALRRPDDDDELTTPPIVVAAAPTAPERAPSLRGATHQPPSHHDEPTRIPPPVPAPQESGLYALPFAADASPQPSLDPSASLRSPRSPTRTLLIGVIVVAALAGIVTLLVWPSAPTRGTIEVVSLPPGAEVNLDGTALGRATPLTIDDVDPSSAHHVRVSTKGYDVWESDVRFTDSKRVRLQAVLLPTVATLAITSTPPGAEAIVNGRIRGLTPVTVNDVPPNDDVTVELRLRGYKVARQSLSFGGKRELAVTIPLEKVK